MKILATGQGIYEHTMEDTTICGGRNIEDDLRRSCITLKDGAWETSVTLQEDR